MDVTELFSFIKDFGFPVVLSWFLLVRMENKLAGLTDVSSRIKLQHCLAEGRTHKKDIVHKMKTGNCVNAVSRFRYETMEFIKCRFLPKL